MPNPKTRHSKARRDKRRAHDALARPTRPCQADRFHHRGSHRIARTRGD